MTNSEVVNVTPWTFTEEWKRVCRCVMSPNENSIEKAVEEISVWKSRCDRLPAGVEATLCLMKGILCYSKRPNDLSISLTLSTSINRFLNVISHSGLNLLGLTKYFEVAQRFHIPDWIVEVRHETAHGHMPSKELLLQAVAFSMKWIRLNYWQQEESVIDSDGLPDFTSTEAYQEVHADLDCYRYLKIYTVWQGFETISDLRDQQELYDHVTDLLRNQLQVRGGKAKKRFRNDLENDLDKVKIREAANIARNEIHKFISSIGGAEDRSVESEDKVEIFIANLVGGEMLLPTKEFVLSLCEGEEVVGWNGSKPDRQFPNASVQLPENLVKIWSDVFLIIARSDAKDMLVKLLLRLREPAASNDAYQSALACAWISEICASLCYGADRDALTSFKFSEKSKYSKRNKLMQKKVTAKVKLESNENHRDLIKFQSKDVREIDVQDFCSQVIKNPLSINTLSFISNVFRLRSPRLVESQTNSIISLIQSLYGRKSNRFNTPTPIEGEVKTKDDLTTDIQASGSIRKVNEKHADEWFLCDDVDWTNVPFGVSPLSNHDMGVCDSEEVDLASECDRKLAFIQLIDDSEVSKVHWDQMNAANPHRKRRGGNSYGTASSLDTSGTSEQLAAIDANTEDVHGDDVSSDEVSLEDKDQETRVPLFYRVASNDKSSKVRKRRLDCRRLQRRVC